MGKLFGVEVEIFMIESVDDTCSDHITQVFEIDNISGIGIDWTRYFNN